MTDLTLRFARAGEAGALSRLALAAKAHWGYDEAFLRACREALTVTEQDLRQAPHIVVVAERDGQLLGFGNLSLTVGGAYLDKLFVSPEALGQGVGQALWARLLGEARARGLPDLLIESDPHAEGFYRRLGAERIGDVPSEAQPGRLLPLLRVRF